MTYQEAREAVDQITDKLGKPVDEGIKDLVACLNALGIHTSGSCEGHLDHGTHTPWIDIDSDKIDQYYPKMRGIDVKSAEFEKLHAEICRLDLKERQKLVPYLDEFYRDRPTPYLRRIVLLSLGWKRTRLEPQGTGLIKLEPKARQAELLAEYQQEFADFTDFLKKKLGDEKH